MSTALRFNPKFMFLAACLIAAAVLVLSHPDLQVGTDDIPLPDSHNPAHSPVLNAEAQARVETVISSWTAFGPPNDPNTQCVRMLVAGEAVRWIVWKFTGLSAMGVPRGDLSWFDRNGWQDSYPNKSGNTLTDVPKDLRGDSRVTMQEANCSDFPNLPPLAPAQ